MNSLAPIIPFPTGTPQPSQGEIQALRTLFADLSGVPDNILLAYLSQRFTQTQIKEAIANE